MNLRQMCQLVGELNEEKDSLFNKWPKQEFGEKNEPILLTPTFHKN